MESFFDSVECRSGTHCQTCRNRAGGTGFRTGIAAYFRLPNAQWECPHGRPWDMDCKPAPLPILPTPPGPAPAATRSLELCRQCDKFNGSICELQFPNGCCLCTWQAFLERGTCPLTPPRWSSTANLISWAFA